MIIVKVAIKNVPTFKLCKHAAKIKIWIDEHDILAMFVDECFAMNAMFKTLLLNLKL